jgi:hypothetical protein
MTVLHRTLLEHAIVTTHFNPQNPAKLRSLARRMAIIIPGLVLAACAMNPADAQSSTPTRVADAHRACAQTMGLNPADTDYQMCVGSLLQTLASLDQASLVQRDRQACMQRGLQPGTRDFATCVVDAETPLSN